MAAPPTRFAFRMTGRRRGRGICHRLGARVAKRAREPFGGKAGLAATARAERDTAATMTARAKETMDRHGRARLNLGHTLARFVEATSGSKLSSTSTASRTASLFPISLGLS